MPRIAKPLNDTQVKNAKPKGKEYNLCDGKGLMLRVKPNGTKLWVFNYSRPYTKKRANISFGTYPPVTLSKARKQCLEAHELLKQDIDPKEARIDNDKEELSKANNTFKHVALRWFEVKKTTVSDDYADDVWRSFELHILPSLAKLPVHKINAPDTIKILEPIAAKGSLETVKRLSQRLNEVMTFAINTGLVSSNPLAGIKNSFASPEKKNLPTITISELPEFLNSLSSANITKTTRHLIEWQLHTMVRPSEAAGTCWDEIDMENGLWNIPASRMKKKRPHTVPLTDQAFEILEKMRPLSGHRKHVFASHNKPRTHTNPQTANVAIKRMGYGRKLVAHGLRSLASTALNEQGFNYDVIEAALAHIDPNETRRAYNRAEYIEQRREMMGWWSSTIKKSSGTK